MSLRSRLGIAYPFIVFGVLMVGGVAAIALLTSIVTITIAIRRERRRPEPADDPADEGPLVMS